MEGPKAKRDLAVTLVQRAGVNYSLAVLSDAERLEGFLQVERHRGPETQVKPEDVLEFLRSANLKLIPDVDAVVRAAVSGDGPKDPVKVAEGRPPQKGQPARPAWRIPLEKKKEVRPADAESVDYREFVYIPQVDEGGVIFEEIPPTRGEAGETVTGEPIEGILGDPLGLQFGENVKFDPAQGLCYATAPGMVIFEEGRLWVSPVFRVTTDVDFETGNIEFNGEVQIEGNIQDGFVVRAAKAVTVFKSVMAATLTAGGDITIHEGATGQGKGVLDAGGRVIAKYLNAVTVRAKGDIQVTSEIINCEVRTKGKVLVPRGNVYGGHVVAVEGIEARQLGSPMLIPTKITAGVDPEVEKRAATLGTHLNQCDLQIERVIREIKLYVENPQEVLKLPPQKRDHVRGQLQSLLELRKRRREIEAERGGLDFAAPSVAPEIKVHKTIFPKTTISIGRCSDTYATESYGPITLVADPEKSKLRKK